MSKNTLFKFTTVVVLIILNSGFVIDRKVNLPQRPKVILIIVDTLRADHLSGYGYGRKISPNLDRLSRDSILFKNAISPAPWTTPSIGSIFTSRYPAVLGFEDEAVKIDDNFLTLAEIFKENNFVTRGIISHDYISSSLGFNQGFDFYDEENARGHGHISSPSITQKAIAFLQEHKDDKFFLFLHYFDPHYDYILHENYNYYPDYEGPLSSGQPIDKLQGMAPAMSAHDLKYLKALYDSEISFTDEYIGKFLEKLKEMGLYHQALIILTADHGEEFCERGDYWIGHTKKLYQEQIHVPLIIKLPGGHKNKIVGGYVGLIDLMPTIVNYLGLSPARGYEAEGEIINIRAGREPEGRKIFSETKRWVKRQSVIWQGWKLIYDLETAAKELYDLKADPAESKNIAGENKEVLKTTEAFLREWNNYIKKSPFKTKGPKPDFSQEQKKRLKSLGYIQ